MVEIMVAAAISLVVFAMAFTAMIRFSRVHYSLATQADMDREFRYAVNLITDDFRALNDIEFEDLADQEIAKGELPDVILTIPSIPNAEGQTPTRTVVTYSVGDDAVMRRIYAEYDGQNSVMNSQSTRLISNVSDFTVTRVAGTSSFDLTLATFRQAGGDAYEKSMTTRVASRN